jgi:hypothetical protein
MSPRVAPAVPTPKILTKQIMQVIELLNRHHFTGIDENSLQSGISQVLAAAGIDHEREVSLSRRDRIDVLLGDSGIGIECKVKGSPNQTAAQLIRYLGHDRIQGLILVTSRLQVGSGLPPHLRITGSDGEVREKPLRVLPVRRAFL